MSACEAMVYGAVLDKAKELGISIHAIGGVEDHVHHRSDDSAEAGCRRGRAADEGRQLPLRQTTSAVASRSSSWQDGYGVLTLGERSMPDVVKYVKNQRQHHSAGTTIPVFERTDENAC